MGAIGKEARIKGRTLEIAFRRLQNEDENEYGHDTYSGGWNNSQGVREVSAKEFEEDTNKFEPGFALCVQKPIYNTNTIKTEVNRHPNKEARNWITKYVARPTNGSDTYVGISEDKLANAITKARVFVEKNPDTPLSIHITKELQSTTLCADIKYKRSTKERDGIWEIKGTLPY